MSVIRTDRSEPASAAAGGDAEPRGRVFWITGLSGAGKTTVATLIAERFRERHVPAILLDGDRLRAAMAPDAGHTVAERRRLAFAYARLCGELAGQGFVVVCATVSMFQAVRDWSRAEIPGYREIYLRVPLKEIEARDSKGLFRSGAVDIMGVDVLAEEPAKPDLTIDNYGACGPEVACESIWTNLVETDGRLAQIVSNNQ